MELMIKRPCKLYGLSVVWLLACLAHALGDIATNPPASQELCFAYSHDVVSEVPWSIHIFKIRRSHAGFEFDTSSGSGGTLGMATVSEQLKLLPPGLGKPLAAINGDFYDSSRNYQGRPRDIQIRQGELVSGAAGHTSLWMDREGNPRMSSVQSNFRVVWEDGKVTPMGLNQERNDDAAVLFTEVAGGSTRTAGGVELVLERVPGSVWLPLKVGQTYQARIGSVRHSGNSPLSHDSLILSLGPKLLAQAPVPQVGSMLRLITETSPDLSGAGTAIGGGPALVCDGKAMEWPGIFQMRHPRSAIGWNRNYIFLVEVDGRQGELSVGMTFPELAAYMRELGCQQAMNFDGGGSATLWVEGKVVNSPSEGRERPCANALVFLKKPAVTPKSF